MNDNLYTTDNKENKTMETKTIKELLAEHNLQHSVWGKRIIKAQKSPDGFTERDKHESLSWVTCACGRVTPDIPRAPRGIAGGNAPLDDELRGLGNTFHRKVRGGLTLGATKTLIAIEKRAIEVANSSS